MAKEEKVVEVAETAVNAETPVAATVPQEEYQRLYDQAISLDARYKKLVAAYNALLELYLSSK